IYASVGSAPVDEDAAETHEVQEIAADESIEMPLVSARITQAGSSPSAPKRHEVVLVLDSPSDARAATSTDMQLRDLAARAASYWQNESNGLISQFDVKPTVTRT